MRQHQGEFPDLPKAIEPPVHPQTSPAIARVRRPVRNQEEWLTRRLDSLLS